MLYHVSDDVHKVAVMSFVEDQVVPHKSFNRSRNHGKYRSFHGSDSRSNIAIDAQNQSRSIDDSAITMVDSNTTCTNMDSHSRKVAVVPGSVHRGRHRSLPASVLGDTPCSYGYQDSYYDNTYTTDALQYSCADMSDILRTKTPRSVRSLGTTLETTTGTSVVDPAELCKEIDELFFRDMLV